MFLRSFEEPLIKFVAFVNQYKNTPSASLLKFYLVVKDSRDIETIKHTPLLTLSELRSQEYDVEYHVAEIDSTEKGMAVVYKIDDSQKIYRPYLKDISSVDGLQFVRVNNLQELF